MITRWPHRVRDRHAEKITIYGWSTMNRPGFGGGSLVESQATRLIRSPSSYRASNSVGGLYPQAP